jgi:hypothetical protein
LQACCRDCEPDDHADLGSCHIHQAGPRAITQAVGDDDGDGGAWYEGKAEGREAEGQVGFDCHDDDLCDEEIRIGERQIYGKGCKQSRSAGCAAVGIVKQLSGICFINDMIIAIDSKACGVFHELVGG